MELISRNAVLSITGLHSDIASTDYTRGWNDALNAAQANVEEVPTVDPVHAAGGVYCRECIFYHPAHIRTSDGGELRYEDVPGGIVNGKRAIVGIDIGVNVGGMCECEKNSGYEVDKSVFREENDFCRRGMKKA